uniref:Integrase core domain containing protein n=3 Tax=Oryza sativa subsp. japonica TaxID=39947 RepID=Q10J81_ORYSJ|nr:integrase core domain containing protein [Oryza sativa Japonica Group]ABF96757.1 retrotransposon protein, putative, Ty1-copia subclass [Oryza sativa Japonica Group]
MSALVAAAASPRAGAAATVPGDGMPGAGAAVNDNVNGGSSASQSSGGTFSGSPHIVHVMIIVLIFWIKICRYMTIFPTIQKPDRSFSVVGFALKPHAFDGSNYKRWKARALLWLTAMQCFYVSRGKRSEPPLSPEEEVKFEASDCLFRGALISILADNIVDVYMHMPSGKDMWDALEAKFGVSDAGSELYVMEQFYDYKMVDDRSVVEQAHEIQMLAKELENNNCELSDKFVAGGIIAKLPPSWSDFATSLKHKRQEFSVSDLIGSLGVEEKARAKDNRHKKVEGGSSANMVQKKNPHASHNNKKVKPDGKPKATTNFKKKGKGKANGDCFVCGKSGHWAKDCPKRKDRKSANMVISKGGETSGYGKLLPTVLSVFHSSDWWVDTGANIHVGRGSSLSMGNGSLAAVHGVGMVDLKLTSGKTVQLKNVQHVLSIKKNLVSGSLLCREGFRLVFESNKCVVSKYGTFVGKGYDRGGLFRFSLDDMCNNHNVVNHISENGSKCHTCVQSKQSRKPHKASEARNLAPLELVHFDLKALHYFKTYKAEVENQLERKIKRLRSDRGGEYFSNEFASFCEEFGIIHERTPLYSPQSNGVAERKNRTLTEMVNAMLDTTGLSKEWWGEAVLTACHVLNKILMKHKDVTPFEEWERKKLNLSYLRTWGCLAKVSVPIAKKRKLGPNTVDCVFIGCAIHSVGYRFLIVNSGVPDMRVGTIIESRDATFFENEFPMKHTPRTSSQETVIPHEHFAPIEHNDQTPEGNPEEDNIVDTRKSKRQRVAKSFGDDYIVYLVDDTPRTIEEAYSSPDAYYWKEAVRSEMDSIMSNASHGLLVHQMDVKTAFLNGELEEEIYMDQPDEYVLEGQEGMGCKLLKSLYGLKQAPKQWHEKFDTTLISVGFVVNEADKCVYYRYGGGEGVILCLYVDDILIFGTSLNVIEEVKDFLSKSFEMKDLGVADVIINIKLLRGDEGGITLVQSHYVDKVLSRFGYSDCMPAPTPYDPSVLLRKNRRIARDQLRYSQIIGSLMYLASATRPDISFAVSKLSRFVSNPGDDHWQALERVMRYLKGTMSYGIHYTRYPKLLEGYSDSNWISDADEIKAASEYVFTLGGGVVSWKSCKQTILTRSTMEAELTALDTATVEAECLRELLMDLPMVEKPVPAILMNYDNQTMIIKVNSSKDNMKSSRHIKRRLKSVRKHKNSGVIAFDYVQTARNLADQFTKGLPRNVIDSASREMGLIPT